MPGTADLAEQLTEFDERLAGDLLELICAKLGGPAAEGDRDMAKIRAFLADSEAARSKPLERMSDVADSPATTSEWKSEFGHSERLRALGLALAKRLTAGVSE